MNEFHLYLYGPARGPIETSFEDAQSRLTSLPRLYFEPDGSFVWARDGGRQQVFGMIYDAAGRIQYIELRGSCEVATWRRLIQAVVGGKSSKLEVLRLPDQQLQDLQRFEFLHWPEAEEGPGELL